MALLGELTRGFDRKRKKGWKVAAGGGRRLPGRSASRDGSCQSPRPLARTQREKWEVAVADGSERPLGRWRR